MPATAVETEVIEDVVQTACRASHSLFITNRDEHLPPQR
jgi:hypothetical protein